MKPSARLRARFSPARRPLLVGGLAAALLLFLPFPASAQGRTSARLQFEKAEKARIALQGKPQQDRKESEYRSLINAYRRVYHLSPAAPEVTKALLSVAELYQEMGRLFDRKYFQAAIDAYQFLLHEYPTTRYRDDALFTIGQIQHEDLGDRELARKTFEEFLKRYPRSDKADLAREQLAAIKAEVEQAKKPATGKDSAEQSPRVRLLPQVTSIRHWNSENSTRVVIDIEEAVQYRAERISNPDRIYFDLLKAKLSSTLAGKTLEVQNGFLKTIRVAQNQAGIVRVVLEVEKVKDYSVFFLPNPYRMVVDVFGEGAPVARAEPKSPPKPPVAASGVEAKSSGPVARTEEPAASVARSERETPPGPRPAAPKEEVRTAEAASAPKEKAETAVRTEERAAPARATVPPPAPHPTRNGQLSMTRALGLKIGRIVIDAGHGGHDTGTIGPTGLMEKDLCLDIALRLGRLIQEKLPGTEIIYTREDDTFVPLENRTAIANQARADLFISIHANSSRDKRARGVETYYLNFASSEDALEVAARENALSQSSVSELQDLLKKIARNDKVEESRELAAEIQEHLSKRLQRAVKGVRNRGVKRAPFVVLIGANMPSILAEVSFLSNPADESLLKKGEHRARIAEGIYRGVESYLQNLNSLTYNASRAVAANHD